MSGLPNWARVGAKVVCVAKEFDFVGRVTLMERLLLALKGDPRRGAVYVICRTEIIDGEGFVCLKGHPLTYGIAAFRPLVTIEDDLEAHFSELLNVSTPQTVEA